MALTDTAVRQAKPSGKNYTLKDSGGLALFVGPKGAKQWHLRFYWLGKQARIQRLASIGLKYTFYSTAPRTPSTIFPSLWAPT